MVSFNEGEAIFRNDTFIISSNEVISHLLYTYLISNLYTYFQFLTSSNWGIATRPAIRLGEYISFPFVQPSLDVEKELIEMSKTFLERLKEYYKEFALGMPYNDQHILSIINSTINNIYNIRDHENDLICYAIDISRYQFQESKQSQFTRRLNNKENTLEKYIYVFLSEFNNLYKHEHLRADVYRLDYFIAINFVFQKENLKNPINFITDVTDEKAIFEILSNNLSINKKTENLYIQKDLKGFEDNSFYIIKPNEYKCWHKAIAWYDVAEIKAAIEAAEIDHLTENWNAS